MKKKFLPLLFVAFVISSVFFALSSTQASESLPVGSEVFAYYGQAPIGEILVVFSVISLFLLKIILALKEADRTKAKMRLAQELKDLPPFIRLSMIRNLPEDVQYEILNRIQREEERERKKTRKLLKKQSKAKSIKAAKKESLDAQEKFSKEESYEPQGSVSLVKTPPLTINESTERRSHISLKKE